jgi:tetratricopeptide (TPR) repeat protein
MEPSSGAPQVSPPDGRGRPDRQGSADPGPAPRRRGLTARICRAWPFWLAALASVAAFSSGLTGGFVYDDSWEIVSNPLIRDPRHLGKALVSDTWAFRAGRNEVVSSYWRPCRTLWEAAGYQLFGIRSALGWHLGSLALHLGALAAAHTVLRRLGASPPLGAAILLLFAVHPTRVESVTWISAFQDPLAAVFLLGSLALVVAPPAPRPLARGAAAVGLFVLGLLSKEAAITFPAVVFSAILSRQRAACSPSWHDSLAKAAAATGPFLLVIAPYLAARKAILGVFFSRSATAPFSVALLSLPGQFAFYLGESLLPFSVGPVHPLRPVHPGEAGIYEFWLPAVLSAAALAGLFLLARRSPLRLVGLAVFLFLLAPSLPVSNLSADRIVQDRYLYLPLFGLLSVILPALAGGLSRLPRVGTEYADRALLALAIAASLPLGLGTARYARAWTSDASLWAWGVKIDPGSPIALGQHALWLYRSGRNGEAREFADRAVRISPDQREAVLTRARIREADRRLADAERDYRRVVALSPDRPDSWEDIGSFYDRNGRPDEAARLLRIGRDRLPFARVALIARLADVLRRAGRKEEALLELESVRPPAKEASQPSSSAVLFQIGLLSFDLGRAGEARSALVNFLEATAGDDDPEIQGRREDAAKLLARLDHPAGQGRPTTSR